MESYFMDDFGYFDSGLPEQPQWQLFYPNNPSLAEDLQRLFSHLNLVAPSIQQQEFQKRGIQEEFRKNGTDPDDCPPVPFSAFTPLIPRAVVGKRSQKSTRKKHECVFCKNNGEQKDLYQGHVLKDKNGRVTCPVLRRYTCPKCGAFGDSAHTLKYCPKNNGKDSLLSLKLANSSFSDGNFTTSVWPC